MLHLWPYGTAFRILFASMKHGVSDPRQVPIMAGGWPGFLLAAGHIIQRHPVELRCISRRSTPTLERGLRGSAGCIRAFRQGWRWGWSGSAH